MSTNETSPDHASKKPKVVCWAMLAIVVFAAIIAFILIPASRLRV